MHLFREMVIHQEMESEGELRQAWIRSSRGRRNGAYMAHSRRDQGLPRNREDAAVIGVLDSAVTRPACGAGSSPTKEPSIRTGK